MVAGPDRAREAGQLGFSVAECILLLAMLVVFGTTAVTGMHRLHQAWSLRGAAYLLESTLQWGRMYAVSSNASVELEINAQGSVFYLADPATGEAYQSSVRQLTGGIRIVSAPRRALRFFPRGNAAPAGTFVVRGEAGQYSVIVNVMGRIRVRKD